MCLGDYIAYMEEVIYERFRDSHTPAQARCVGFLLWIHYQS